MYDTISYTRDHCGRDRIVVGFTTTYATIAYHHLSCEFKYRSWWGLLDTRLCDKICQWLAAGRWFSTGTPVASTNKTDSHNIIETNQQPYHIRLVTNVFIEFLISWFAITLVMTKTFGIPTIIRRVWRYQREVIRIRIS